MAPSTLWCVSTLTPSLTLYTCMHMGDALHFVVTTGKLLLANAHPHPHPHPHSSPFTLNPPPPSPQVTTKLGKQLHGCALSFADAGRACRHPQGDSLPASLDPREVLVLPGGHA